MASLLILMTFLLGACQSKPRKAASSQPDDVLCGRADSAMVNSILKKFSHQKDEPIGKLVVEVGKEFLGEPYVSYTLEHGPKEPLTISLKELDCTTFTETALALARTIKDPQSNLQQYANELEKIRYRNGKRNGYPSRLHYFSDWIYNNQEKGIVSQPAEKFGKPLDIQVNFMSTHPNSYSVLMSNPELVPAIAKQEKVISERHYFYLPKDEIDAKELQLKDGDIVGIVTNIKGLDIAHVGILVRQNGHMHLMNASTLSNDVVISDPTLAEFLNHKRSYLGIMIARPEN
ncbi:MAG TPA: N-acetylmuramoyl-L-alanine amidase-like domain-containing protein [Sunxiuqinia sp.]|nr:N-acetylmuramoyl-L-alanine amidase-like domain-containing protein [Sunxiuqinia sp.]